MPHASAPCPLRPTDADRALAAQAMEEIAKVAAVMSDLPACAQAHLKIALDRSVRITRAFGTDGREIGARPVEPRHGRTPTAHESMCIARANADLTASQDRLKALLEAPEAQSNRPAMSLDLSLELRDRTFQVEVWYADAQIAGRTPADKLARTAMIRRLLAAAEPPASPAGPPPATWSVAMRGDTDGKLDGMTRQVAAPDLSAAVRIAVRQFALALAVRRATPPKALRIAVTGAERIIAAAEIAGAVTAARGVDAGDPDLAGILDAA